MPLASVIIPCYAQGHFLPQSVASALSQTLSDIEVVVIDDGSPTDAFSELGALAADPRLRLLRQTNRGLELTRNRGIAETTAPYLAFLDSDDWWAPEFLAKLVSALSDDPRLGLAYCEVEEVFEGEGARLAKDVPYSIGTSRAVTSGDILPSLLCGGYFPPNTVVVPRAVLQQTGPFEHGLGGHADYDLWLRIAAHGFPARFLDERLAYYRIHGANMSFRQRHMDETRLLALTRLLRQFPEAAAGALAGLFRLNSELFHANRLLHDALLASDRDRLALDARINEDAARAADYFQSSQDWMKNLQQGLDFQAAQAAYWRQQAEALAAPPPETPPEAPVKPA